MEQKIIEMQGLTKHYGNKIAVNNLDLSICQGEIFGLLGPNGAGKTTTILMLLGLTEPTAGRAFIEGLDCTRNPVAVKRVAGYMPDNVGFYPDLTGRQNLRFTGRLNGLGEDMIEERIEQLLKRVGMTEYGDQKTGTYSKGMKQRLGIADVLMKDPRVIIMDEPTVAVDPQSRNRILEGILELNKKGATIIYTSHYMEEVEQICSRIMIMDHGRSIAAGTSEELKRMIKTGETIIIEGIVLTEAQLKEIAELPHVFATDYNEERTLKVKCTSAKHNLVRLLNYLQEQEVAFGRGLSEMPTLNDVFLEITGKELRD